MRSILGSASVAASTLLLALVFLGMSPSIAPVGAQNVPQAIQQGGSDNELKDAYLELGGDEDDAAGHTWGQQAATNLRERFGTSRMDKVFFCGDMDVTKFEKFGMDVIVENQDVEDDLLKLGLEKPWITDHLGVWAEFEVKKG